MLNCERGIEGENSVSGKLMKLGNCFSRSFMARMFVSNGLSVNSGESLWQILLVYLLFFKRLFLVRDMMFNDPKSSESVNYYANSLGIIHRFGIFSFNPRLANLESS